MGGDDRGARAPSRPSPPWWLVAGPMVVLAVVSALLTPLMGLSDEPAHAIHAVGVVHGTLVGDDAVRTDPGSGWTRTETAVPVPAAYAELLALPTCFAFRPGTAADCAPPVDDAPGPTVVAQSTVGTYAPWWYAVVGWPSRVLAPPTALHAMRFVGALVFGALVGSAAVSLSRVARRWGTVGLLLALPPIAVHLAGGINPSGTEIAAAVALWAASVEVVSGPTVRGAVGRWVAAGLVVALVRPLGPAIALGIPLLTGLALGGSLRRPWLAPPARTGAVVLGLGALAGFAWSLWRGTLGAFSGFPDPSATGLVAVRRSLALVPERLVELVGVLGWSDVTLPRVLVAGWLLAVGLLVAAALRHGDRDVRVWLVVLAVVVLVLPIAADVRSAPRIGFVWQGRYTLPIAAGLPILAGVVVDTRTGWDPVRSRRLATAATAAVALAHVGALVTVVRRFGGATTPGWPTTVLLGVAAAAAVALVLTQREVVGPVRGEVPDRG